MVKELVRDANGESCNAAAMREACQKMLDLLMSHGNGKTHCILTWDEFNDAQKIVRSALSAPPRNCDRFADELDAQLAFLNEVWLIFVTKDTMLERDKFENWTEEMKSIYAKWLFAEAKGANKNA